MSRTASQIGNYALAIALSSAVLIDVGVGEMQAQTAAPPAAAPAPAAPSAPSALPSGAPAIGPTPGTPPASGVVQPPAPSTNSTPSGANVDLFPPSRLTTPGGPAGAQPPPSVQAPQSSAGRAQPGSAASVAPKASEKTGGDHGVSDCIKLWDSGTHMSRAQWRDACARIHKRIETVSEEIARQESSKREGALGDRRRSTN